MKKTLLLSLLIFLTTNVLSQKISGIVLDSISNKPIEKAHIFLNNKVFFTNKKGRFSFYHKKKTQQVFTVSHLQYHKKNISYQKNSRNLIIYLKEKKEVLSEVNIKSKQFKKNKVHYQNLNKLPKPIHSFASTIKDDKIYVFGGDASVIRDDVRRGLNELVFNSFQEILNFLSKPKTKSFHTYLGNIFCYNFQLNEWSQKENSIRPKAYHNVISYKEKFYLFGGKRFSKKKTREYLEDKIEVYKLSDQSIKIDNTNPHQAVNFESILYQDKIIFIGGSTKKLENGKKKYINKVHFYDLKSGYWYLLTQMSKGKETKGIIANDKLYLFGGYKNKALKEIEVYNLKTGKWKHIGNLFNGMKNPAITKHKNIIYMFENSRIITFNIITKTLKEYIIDLKFYSSKMHYYKNKLFIMGGYFSSQFDKVPSSGFYSIDIKEFVNTKPFNIKTL